AAEVTDLGADPDTVQARLGLDRDRVTDQVADLELRLDPIRVGRGDTDAVPLVADALVERDHAVGRAVQVDHPNSIEVGRKVRIPSPNLVDALSVRPEIHHQVAPRAHGGQGGEVGAEHGTHQCPRDPVV